MDLDIGNIFYIIITLIVVIIGILGKKKPASKGSGKGKGSQLPSFMENLEKVLNPDQEEQYTLDPREVQYTVDPQEEQYAVDPREVQYAVDPRKEQYAVDIREGIVDLPQDEPDPGYNDVHKPLTLMEEYESLLRSKGQLSENMVEEMVTEPLEIIELDEDGGVDYLEVIREFEVGKAIVYSTIINRLDY